MHIFANHFSYTNSVIDYKIMGPYQSRKIPKTKQWLSMYVAGLLKVEKG